MRVSTLAAAAFIGYAAAAPTYTAPTSPYSPFPLSDGFPSPSASQLKTIQKVAGGSLPGGGLSKSLTDLATVTLSLIALNEAFEVAYFNSLLTNVENKVSGYTSFPAAAISYDFVVDSIKSIRAQEELHYLGVNAALTTAGKSPVALCKYLLPKLPTYLDAITLANTFTDVVLGVLPQAQTVFAENSNEQPYINLFGSVIAQEAEQNGWYRVQQKKIASSAPFKTTEGPSFAFSFLKGVIAPGCAGVDFVSKYVPTYPPITVVSKPAAKDVNVRYSVPGKIARTANSLVYISGQNLPVAVNIYDVKYANGVTTFGAKFPFATNGLARGLSIAAVVDTPSSHKYASIAEVAAHTLFGPGIIEVE